jgi:hypothetical protein
MPVRTSETAWTVGAHEASRRAPAARVREIGPGPWLTSSVAFAAVLATNWLSLGIDHLKTTLLNANWEFSWSHDVDTVVLVLGVWAAATGWRRQHRNRKLWAGIAAILTIFFLDEVSPLHAQIGAVSAGKLLYVPVLAGLAAGLWCLAAGTTERVLIGWGLAALLLSFGMHTPGLHILHRLGYTNWIYQTGVGFKEGAELAGLLLVVFALWRLSADIRSRPTPVDRQT